MTLLRRSIRVKIIALLAVPLVGLVGVWAFATVLTVGPVLGLLDAETRFEDGSRPATALVAQLQAERRAAVTHLGQPDAATLELQFADTDRALADFRARSQGEAFRDAASPAANQRLDTLLSALTTVVENRPAIVDRVQRRTEAMAVYTDAIDSTYHFLTALTVAGDAELSLENRAVVELGRGRELISQMDAILAGVDISGTFQQGERFRLHQLIGARRLHYELFVADLPESVRDEYAELVDSEPMVALTAMENRILAEVYPGRPLPIDMADWRDTETRVVELLAEFELGTSEALAEEAAPIAVRAIVQMVAIGALGLVLVVGSLYASLRLGRSLIRRLTSLRDSARELAGSRLPDVVARLRRAEPVDVAAEAPELRLGPDEIGEVGRAFNQVQRTAVSAAVDEAKLRHGLNEVFLNIARRSQSLLHRQLELLDELERRTHEPEELEQLFKLDHMTTRMRRHAENLVILAGSSPGRGWRSPVPVVDVIRGAVSEVEEYARVNVPAIPEIAIAGRAVGDMIHLLAELIENATAYSPPHTEVRVSAEVVPNGLVVEIEDRGLGMTPAALAEANAVLKAPPQFDPAASERLGLLVVAQIATRLEVRVTLCPSPYGGVTAVVLISPELLAEAPPPLPGLTTDPPAPAAPPATPPTERPAGRPAPVLALVGSSAPPRPVPGQDDELPRRVSKRHLSAVPTEHGSERTEPTLPPAEEVRARLSAYQQGLARGRADADDTRGDPRGPDHQ